MLGVHRSFSVSRPHGGRSVLMARSKTEVVRDLNDTFRSTFEGGRVVMTAGVDALPSDVKAMAIRRVATYAEFAPENDPHSEHDFGNFEFAGQKFFWKID